MTQEELNKAVENIAARYNKLNTKYIRQIAEQIKAIGEFNPKSLNQIAEMVRMNANISEIVMELNRLTELTKKDVKAIMERLTEDEIMNTRYLPYYAEKSGLPEEDITPEIAKQYVGADAEERLRRSVLAMAAQTDDRLENLSNTTAISDPYRAAIDKAVLAVHENVTSYTEAMRDTVTEIGSAGMQVRYESGYHRRLDTAVRQNILDATGQLAQTAAIMVGEALEYNAFEISAHAMSAPDHEPVQGHVFLTDEFYKLQQNQPSQDADGQQFAAIRRPIKEWNCGHFAFPFDTRFSKRKYTPEQLQKFIDDNKAGCVIGQKRYTLYEASQIMRRIECEIRREKDTAVAAQAAGDDQLRVDCQLRINHLSGLYKQVTDASGLTPRRERMTVEGFRRAKVPEKGLTPDRMAKTEEQLNSVKPVINTSESLQELRKYAESKGIQFYNPNAYDGDIDIMKRQIDAIASVREEYGITQKLTIQTVRASEDLGRTSNDGRTIYLNSSTYRDREETAEYMSKDRYFSTNVAEAIGVHEMGHIIHKKYGGIGLDIACEAWYNIHKEKVDYKEMLGILRKNVSIYSSTRKPSDEGKKFDSKQYCEVIPEILAKNTYVPDDFTEEFIRLLKVRCGL